MGYVEQTAAQPPNLKHGAKPLCVCRTQAGIVPPSHLMHIPIAVLLVLISLLPYRGWNSPREPLRDGVWNSRHVDLGGSTHGTEADMPWPPSALYIA